MLIDILMESLMSMDDDTLDYVLESCTDDEIELIDDYTNAMEMCDLYNELMSMSGPMFNLVIESIDDDTYEYLCAVTEDINTAARGGSADGAGTANSFYNATKNMTNNLRNGIKNAKNAVVQSAAAHKIASTAGAVGGFIKQDAKNTANDIRNLFSKNKPSNNGSNKPGNGGSNNGSNKPGGNSPVNTKNTNRFVTVPNSNNSQSQSSASNARNSSQAPASRAGSNDQKAIAYTPGKKATMYTPKQQSQPDYDAIEKAAKAKRAQEKEQERQRAAADNREVTAKGNMYSNIVLNPNASSSPARKAKADALINKLRNTPSSPNEKVNYDGMTSRQMLVDRYDNRNKR